MTHDTSAGTSSSMLKISAPKLITLGVLLTTGFVSAGYLFIFFTLESIWNVDPADADTTQLLRDTLVAGAVAIAIVLALGFALGGSRSNKAAAIVLAILAVVTLPAFWFNLAAIFGTGAAWKAGLTSGQEPLQGAARGFGIAGLVAAVIQVIVTVGLMIAVLVTNNFGNGMAA